MDITGKVIQILPLQTGEGKNGTWRKQDFVIETEATYPKKVCISAWGDKMDTSLIEIDALINVSFDVESREYNGRWYTDLRAWKLDRVGGGSPSGNQTSAPAPISASIPSGLEGEEDLPF
jgi:hypothetical protein